MWSDVFAFLPGGNGIVIHNWNLVPGNASSQKCMKRIMSAVSIKSPLESKPSE